MSNAYRQCVAFTLVELLVVVAIIVVLLALLVPAMDKAMSEVEKAVCGTTQRKMAMANHMYANDYRHWFVQIKGPNTSDGTSSGVYSGTWAAGYSAELWYLNAEYIKSFNGGAKDPATGWRTFSYEVVCPSNSFKWESGATMSYAFNWTGLGLFHQGLAVNRRRIQQPSGKLQMIDSSDWHTVVEGSNYSQYWDTQGDAPTPNKAVVTYRHLEGANVTHFDMSIQWYTKQRLYNDRMWALGGDVENFWGNDPLPQ